MESWRKELYLAHHGIKGQKWGVRNGPPYPLGASNHSASEKKAGWRQSLQSSNASSGSFARNAQSEVDKIRQKYAVIGDSGTAKSKVTNDAKAIAQKYGFSMVSRPQTVTEDIRNTDPGYYKHQDDDHWLNNCTHSCIAFAARRRGLNVEATPMNDKQAKQGGETVVETCNRYFKGHFTDEDFQVTKLRGIGGIASKVLLGIDVTRTGGNYEKKASAELGKLYQDVPDGGYGMVKMTTSFGGHVFVWYKEDGTVKFADSQGAVNARIDFNNIARYGVPCLVSIRFDNLELDPSKITEAIQSPSSELRHALAFLGGNFKMEAWRQELYHYGIKGMRWGIRRYQNYDGSLTMAGQTRYSRKIENQKAKLNRLYETSGPLSKSYRRTARSLYVTRKQEALQKAKKSGNKADVLVAKQDLKMAKLFKKYGTGDYMSPDRDIYGRKLSSKELEAIKILEAHDANTIPRRASYIARHMATDHAKALAIGTGLSVAVFALNKYGGENMNAIGGWANKGADFIKKNPQMFANFFSMLF